jgi:hypothetical protein
MSGAPLQPARRRSAPARFPVTVCLALVLVAVGPLAAQTPPGVVRVDDMLAAVGLRVPEFGGMFIGEENHVRTLQVYLLDPAPRVIAAVEQAIVDVFGRDRIPPGGIRVLQGQYSFMELKRLYDSGLTTVLSMPDVVFTDIDEVHNRLRVGVASPSAVTAVQRQLDALAIPRAAVTIEITPPFEAQDSLDDIVRPPLGGLRISSPNGGCTLGFNAITLGGEGVPGFVTNSHCTNVQGGTEGTPFGQPSTVDTVGKEAIDPIYTASSGCPSGRVCRVSDSAFVRYTPKVAQQTTPGFIADVCPASSIEMCLFSTFRITNVDLPLAGELVAKVGATTGRTEGVVLSTCANVNVSGTKISLFCQGLAAWLGGVFPIADKGDSGSPVFKVDRAADQFTTDVTLVGLLWGSSGGTLFSFSQFFFLEAELGLLSACAPGFGC